MKFGQLQSTWAITSANVGIITSRKGYWVKLILSSPINWFGWGKDAKSGSLYKKHSINIYARYAILKTVYTITMRVAIFDNLDIEATGRVLSTIKFFKLVSLY